MTAKERREIWLKGFNENKALMEGRVKEEIEKYRKGFCMLHFVDENGKPIAGKKVIIHQASHDFKYGANIFMLDEFKDPDDNAKYREMFSEYFNLATVPFYWDGLEPEQGKPRFDKHSPKIYRRPAPELCVEYCEENGIDAKLHCLVYDKFIPSWLLRDDMSAMEKAYEERIRQIAERYSGRLMEFEVINETLCEQGWNYKSVISEKRDIVEWAFELARKYLPYETLVINEANPIVDAAKQDYRNPYFMQIEKCLLNGASIDKIGLQHHIFTGVSAQNSEQYEAAVKNGALTVSPELYLKGLDVFAELGLPLELTEVTIPTFGETEEDEELQAELLKNIYSVWFSHPSVDTIVYWNTVEGYAYAGSPSWDENRCRGALFHHDLTPKKSALILKKLFNEIWHTDIELITDENGYVEFRGFYGDYTAEINGSAANFGIHKHCDNCTEIEL